MKGLRHETREGYAHGFYWEDDEGGSTHYLPLQTKDDAVVQSLRDCLVKREEIAGRSNWTPADAIAYEVCCASIEMICAIERPKVLDYLRNRRIRARNKAA